MDDTVNQGDAETTAIIKAIAEGFARPIRSPILRTPGDAGLAYENITFPSQDGTPLEAWFMPCEGSSRLIVANHPLSFNRYGFAAHIEPWKSAFGDFAGNDFEVNFIADYKILHDAGYNILTYDFRNFGHSAAANGSIQSGGMFEARDVLGSMAYVAGRADLKAMTLGLFSRCLGANATMFAMAAAPERFANVRCMVAVQPLSVRVIMEQTLERLGLSAKIDALDFEQRLITSRTLDEMSPVAAARSVTTPTFMYQVRDDVLTRPSDVQSIFDAVAAEKKQLLWIQETTKRWDGYCFFQRKPAQPLAWFAKHMN